MTEPKDITWDASYPIGLCDGEPLAANETLQIYYAMGAGRTMRKLAETEGVPVKLRALTYWSVWYSWQDRIREQYLIDSRGAMNEMQELRQEVLKEFGMVVFDAVKNANIDSASLSQISGAIRALFEGFAYVYDALPTKRTQTTNLNGLKFEDILAQMKEERKEVVGVKNG